MKTSFFSMAKLVDRIQEIEKDIESRERESFSDRNRQQYLKDKEKNNSLTKEEKKELKEINDRLAEADRKIREQQQSLKDLNKELEKEKKLHGEIKKGLEQAKKGVKEITDGAKEFGNAWGKADQAVANFMKSVGGSAAGMAKLRREVINLVADNALAARFGADSEKLMQMMTQYTSLIGRNVTASAEGMKNLAAMSAVFGDRKAADFVSRLENFGVSMQEAGRRSGQMFSSAAKHGVSFEAYSKNFLDNIQLAQRYTFKDGLEGLSNMARKSTEIQLSLQQSAAFAEKVSTLEGAVSTGAQLQVLGGAFSAMSNPLGMLNEALNDFEGLQDRITDMFGSFARMNKETGEIEVGAFDRQRIKAAAQAAGMSYDEVMKSVYSQGRRNELGRALSDRGDLSEDMKELIMNIGSFEKGVAGVNINGKFKALNDITESDQQSLIEINRTESDDIKDIAVRLRGWEDAFKGFKLQREAYEAQAVEVTGIGQQFKNLVIDVSEMKAIMLGMPILNHIGNGAWDVGRGLWKAVKSKRASGDVLQDPEGIDVRDVWNGKMGRGASAGAKVASGAAGVAIGGAIGISGINSTMDNDALRKSGQLQRGTIESNSARRSDMMTTYGGSGASIGSLIGSFVGGPLGTLVGGAIGGLVGTAAGAIHAGIKNAQDEKALKSKRFVEQNYGVGLSGDYRNKDMKSIMAALNNDGEISLAEFSAMNKRMREQLLKSGDIERLVKDKDVLEAIKSKYENTTIESRDTNMNVSGDIYINGEKAVQKKGANGGLLVGPSHSSGGMRVGNSNIEVEGGEFVVNKRATSRNLDLLTKINSPGSDIIKPRQMANGGMLTVTPTTKESSSSAQAMELKPLDININGSIKLEGAGGQSVDLMKSLLSNPTFVKEIAALIQKEIAFKADGGLIINKGLR